MRFVDHVLSILAGVELVDIDVALRSTGEEMTTVGESYFSATLDGDRLVGLETLLENVHHANSVGETDDQMEAGWVESHTVGLVVEELANLKLGWVEVVPNADRLIDGAGSHKVLLDTDVHSLDSSGVEGEDEVLVLAVIVGSVDLETTDLHDLVVLSGEDDVVRGGESQASDSRVHDAGLEIVVLALLLFLALWELGDPVVWVLDLLSLLVDDDGTVVARDDEALLERLDALDVEPIAWRLGQEHLEVTVALEQHDLTLVRAHQQSAVRKPGVASVVVGDMRVLLEDGRVGRLEQVVVADSVELVRAVTGYEHGVLVLVAERDLGHAAVAGDSDLLLGEALGFIPSPEDDPDVLLPCEGGEETLLVGRGERNRHELPGVVIGGGEDLSPLHAGDIVDAANGSLRPLAHGQELLGRTQSQGRDTFRALDTWKVLLAPVVSVVNDDVVTARVEHVLVVDEEDVHLHVSLEPAQELGVQRDVLGAGLRLDLSGLGRRTSSGSCILLTLHGNFLYL